MERWINKVAIVTGASSGIGKALIKSLVSKDVKVVGLARRLENMERLKHELKNEKGTFYPIKCDLSKEEDILKAFHWVEKNFPSVNILVNNAGILTPEMCIESTTENMKNIMNVNLIAPSVCTREAVRIMRMRNTVGHIININSILGQNAEFFNNVSFNLYSPSKFALKAFSRIVEQELQHINNPTKITSIFPGLVKTEMPQKEAYDVIPYIYAEDVSDTIIFALSTPPHVQIKELTVTAVPGLARQ